MVHRPDGTPAVRDKDVFGIQFPTLGIDRLLLVSFPVWYRKQDMRAWEMASKLSWVAMSVEVLCMLIGTSVEKTIPLCTIVASVMQGYYQWSSTYSLVHCFNSDRLRNLYGQAASKGTFCVPNLEIIVCLRLSRALRLHLFKSFQFYR